jgi:hypothetical protein
MSAAWRCWRQGRSHFGGGRRLVLHHPTQVLRRILDLLWGDLDEIEMEPR